MQNPIILALDVPNAERALELVKNLTGVVGSFKVGSELFTREGPEMVRRIRGSGASVFLDLKFHDIPNTVSKAVAAAAALDVQMLTIHTGGGTEMMKAAVQSARDHAKDLLILGVTVLTSLDGNELAELGLENNVGKHVERLATLAVNAGLSGLVCSALEVADLRQIIPSEFKLVTPGIRPFSSQSDDQKRTLSAKEALDAGSNWLVIGRPIYGATNPRAAAEEILGTIG